MLHNFTLIQYNATDDRAGIYCTDEEIIETKLVNISGHTAIEVVTLTEKYLNDHARGHFYKIAPKVWADGFGQEIKIGDYWTDYKQN